MDTRRPFTRADAIKAGIEPKLFRGSRFRRLFSGVYVDAAVQPSPALQAAAALLGHDAAAYVSHATAARVYGVPIPPLPDEHVSVPERTQRRPRVGVRCHVCPAPRVRVHQGVRVSEYDQMFVELASLLDLVDLVVVGDNLVRKGRLTCARLVAHCSTSTMPGARRALAAARFVRARVDSPMETRLRMLLVLAGLPEPEVNLTLRDVDGQPLRRFDLSYQQAKVIVEYDGRHHIEREEQWEADLGRREAIDDDGWRLLVVTSRGIYRSPGATLQRVWRVLHARALPGLPATVGDDWRPHFPERD